MNKALAVLLFALVLAAPLDVAPQTAPDLRSMVDQDFTAFDPHYRDERQRRIGEALKLGREVVAAEANGVNNACSHQILFEIEALLTTTAHFNEIDARLADLRRSLVSPRPDHPDATGLWGACYKAWDLKLYATFDRLEGAASDNSPPRPLPAFLAPVGTPSKLRARLDALATSDVRTTGVDHEREFNETATLMQMLVRGRPENYQVSPSLRQALLERVAAYQDPQTGYWGERYRRNGANVYADDLSITFHIVSYLRGEVPRMTQLLDTLLRTRDADYPEGWLMFGQYWNHNDMDVVTLFRYGWPTASPAQRAQMSGEIQKMLDWCLAQSLQPDGSFKVNVADGSVEDAEYYGASFLDRIGFFDPSKRFWTDQDFPQAAEVRTRILDFARRHAASGPTGDHYQSTIKAVGCPPNNVPSGRDFGRPPAQRVREQLRVLAVHRVVHLRE